MKLLNIVQKEIQLNCNNPLLNPNLTWWDKILERIFPRPHEERLIFIKEAEMYAENAKRIRLKTTLQEQRIKERLERIEKEKNFLKIQAIWRQKFCTSLFSLENKEEECFASINLVIDRFNTRKIVYQQISRSDNKKLLAINFSNISLIEFLKTTDNWIKFINPWLNGFLEIEDLGKCKNITVFSLLK